MSPLTRAYQPRQTKVECRMSSILEKAADGENNDMKTLAEMNKEELNENGSMFEEMNVSTTNEAEENMPTEHLHGNGRLQNTWFLVTSAVLLLAAAAAMSTKQTVPGVRHATNVDESSGRELQPSTSAFSYINAASDPLETDVFYLKYTASPTSYLGNDGGGQVMASSGLVSLAI